ncbi:fluoride efflux transporter FluC [Oenococcus kitaharae]|uniref:Fluoride-specific ion channel FluC n=1 Tax=Oenococcus kitaharae DSM 17330 TaxID=1045004 RepID=G9WG76_9LACO|nr:CrcB family protein [Oenococcus kitaharae]EHN59684.1 crcB-like protein [Oenococcus kitaharae DSM 17330]
MLIKLTLISALGTALGGEARYLISRYPRFDRLFGFSLATILINIIGSFLLAIVLNSPLALTWRTFFGSGIIGGLTTFSTFILETINLSSRQTGQKSLLYFAASLFLSLAAFALGVWLIGQ